jgi:hypothetical protein
VENSPVRSLVDVLARYDRLVEVGIGSRTAVAEALAAAGKTVTATDVHPRQVPDGVRFVADDVVEAARRDPADATIYAVDAVYARNLPPELHRPARDVAHAQGADLLFTTLGGDQPVVPVERVTIDEGTLYVAPAP